MANHVSIRIPIYNQPHLLSRCLQSIRNQTLQPDEIILLDDQSTTVYKATIEQFIDLKIKYIRNETNLGAVPNMLNALYYKSECDYVLVFHEDDVMQPQFIEYSVMAFETNPNAAFCCSLISFFANTTDIQFVNHSFCLPIQLNKQQLVKEFLKGKTIGFGTILYKTSKLKPVAFDFKTYSVFGDRPFLLSLIGNQEHVLHLEQELSAVYDHSYDDNRWLQLNQHHVFNLYAFYKSVLKGSINRQDEIGLTHGIVNSYELIPPKNKPNKLPYYFEAWRLGLISIKYLILSIKFIRKTIERF